LRTFGPNSVAVPGSKPDAVAVSPQASRAGRPARRAAARWTFPELEILSLRWEHVNLSGKVLTFVVKGETWEVRPGWLLIEKSKNGRPRCLPMSGKV
jgi:hypothetical protein